MVLSCFVSLKWAFLARTVALCLLQGAGNAGDAHASDTRPLPRELWWVREGKAQAPHQRQPPTFARSECDLNDKSTNHRKKDIYDLRSDLNGISGAKSKLWSHRKESRKHPEKHAADKQQR